MLGHVTSGLSVWKWVVATVVPGACLGPLAVRPAAARGRPRRRLADVVAAAAAEVIDRILIPRPFALLQRARERQQRRRAGGRQRPTMTTSEAAAAAATHRITASSFSATERPPPNKGSCFGFF